MDLSRRQLLTTAAVAGLTLVPASALLGPASPATAAPTAALHRAPLRRTGFEGFGDPAVNNGYTALNINPALPANGTLSFASSSTPPSWEFAQWHSRFDLAGATLGPVSASYLPSGTVGFANTGKTLAKSPDGSILFEAKGSQEYLATRTASDPWPHMLMQQSLPVQPYMDQISSVRYQIDVQIPNVTNATTPSSSYNPGLHAAALSSFFTIQNFNTASPDYMSYVWFSVPIADSRYSSPSIPSGAFVDAGTNSLIYGEPGSTYWSSDVKDGSWHSLDIDLYPLLLTAFSTAQSMGVLTSSTLSEMQLTYYVLGWELPGTFDAAFRFNNLSVWIS